MASASRKTRTTLQSTHERSHAIRRVAGYLRVSTEDQADSGLGLAAQEAKIRAMAEVKGWPAITLYVDPGISGTKESRPQFDELKAAIDAGHVDALIVASLDRIGRKTRIILNLAEQCTAAGVALISIKESFDTSTPAGQFALTLFAGLAQMERDTISQRTIEALDQRGVKYDYKSGMLPLGYKRVVTADSEYIALDDTTAEIARLILKLDRRGMTLRDIADELNARAIPPRRGTRWHHSAVAAVLRHKAVYSGKYPHYPKL